MISEGSLVSVDQHAFTYAGLNFEKEFVGIVLTNLSARKYFNLDTDDNLCEVMISDGRICVFYETDLTSL